MKGLYTIVGMKHRGTEALVSSLQKGEPLYLLREPTNQYDTNAVQVWARGQHVGYVKGSQVRELAGFIDSFDCIVVPTHTNKAQRGLVGRLAVTAEKWPCCEVVQLPPAAQSSAPAPSTPEPDTSDIPESGKDWFDKAKLVEPEKPATAHTIKEGRDVS